MVRMAFNSSGRYRISLISKNNAATKRRTPYAHTNINALGKIFPSSKLFMDSRKNRGATVKRILLKRMHPNTRKIFFLFLENSKYPHNRVAVFQKEGVPASIHQNTKGTLYAFFMPFIPVDVNGNLPFLSSMRKLRNTL